MRESCALRLTIRYLLMFVHRRDLEQSSVSRVPRLRSGACPELVEGRQGAGMLYQISSLHSTVFEKNRLILQYKNPVDSLILGVGRNAGRGFGFWRRGLKNVNLINFLLITFFTIHDFWSVWCIRSFKFILTRFISVGMLSGIFI